LESEVRLLLFDDSKLKKRGGLEGDLAYIYIRRRLVLRLCGRAHELDHNRKATASSIAFITRRRHGTSGKQQQRIGSDSGLPLWRRATPGQYMLASEQQHKMLRY
jgi:hypothetical protein